MIYLVSNQTELFPNEFYNLMTVEESLELLNSWEEIQFDTETSGRNPHLCKILCIQFGHNYIQIVVDCSTIDILAYKNILETKLLIGQNLKFDLAFLYNHNIIPTKVYDTMIIEQLLHLGFPHFSLPKETYIQDKYNYPYLIKFINGIEYREISFSLKAIALKYLGIDIDKTVRGEIIWRGLDTNVIVYAAGDVTYLEDIKERQLEEAKLRKCINAVNLENNFVPVISYLEWCGIRLDVNKWQLKIEDNQNKLEKSLKSLNRWLIKKSESFPNLKKYINYYIQYALFEEVSNEPEVLVNWSSQKQVIPIVQEIGFKTATEDKKTGTSKDSIVEKLLGKQKGIDDEFLKIYFDYQEAAKQCGTYGQNYIDAINPKTGRIHTKFKQLGAASGRMSCGGGLADKDTDLAKYKGLPPGRCSFVQIQNLPSDHITRSSFVPNPGNLMTSIDYSALESRLGADIYDEKAMIDEYLYGSGDIHSLVAKGCFADELEGIEVKDIKNLRPDLRKKAKAPEFACQFGGGAKAISESLGISSKEAKKIEEGYYNMFTGIKEFKAKGAEAVKSLGYVLICKKTGHKLYWYDFRKWKYYESLPEEKFNYELSSKERSEHRRAGAKWERMALNAPTQGTGIIILKYACILFFKWIIQENLFGKVLLCDLVHDEAVIEYPKELESIIPDKLKYFMEKSSSFFCEKLPIPAEASTGTFWIH